MELDDLFDDFAESLDEGFESFHKIQDKNDAKVQDWLNKVTDALIQQSKTRTEKQRDNLAMYRGVQLKKYDRDRDYRIRRLNKVDKFIVNHLHDLVETKVSQMNRLKPAVEVLPTNDEWEDRASAKVVQMLVKHLFYNNNIDYLFQKVHRHARIFGESYIFIEWDKDLGDLHPAYVAARDAGLKEITFPDGSVHNMEKEIRTGDIKFEHEVPWRVLLQRKQDINDCEYVIRIKIKAIDDLKEEYKDKADKIKENDDIASFDLNSGMPRFLEKHVLVFEFTHKATKYVPKGKRIVFTKDVILENSDHPFTHGQLPFIRLTDLDVPERLNGISRFEMIGPIQSMHNNLSTLLVKNIYLMAHAKWVMPRGACKIEQLGNDNTVVQYQGPVPPQMLQTNPNPPEAYNFREALKQEMQTIYGSHGVSRGEIPKGITAASALQFLNELENDRATTEIAKHGFLIMDLARMAVAVVGDKYDVTDGRMLRIVGEDNKYLIRHFDTANLNKSYDIRFNLSTGLPESKAARISRVLEALQRNPQMFSPERWEELLEFGNEEKRISLATEAVRAADSENEDLLNGDAVPQPERWEDHLAHWEAHVRAMQSRQFKEEATPELRQNLIDHIQLTEEAMLEKAATNPAFQAKLARFPLFPIFHHANTMIPKSREHMEAMVQGQSNRGEPISEVIPGTDIEDDINNNI